MLPVLTNFSQYRQRAEPLKNVTSMLRVFSLQDTWLVLLGAEYCLSTDRSDKAQPNAAAALPLAPPKILEPHWRQLSVSYCVLNVAVPEISL